MTESWYSFKNRVFVTFPQITGAWSFHDFHSIDKPAATAYYERLFVGKRVSLLFDAYAHDKKLVQEKPHNLETISLVHGDGKLTVLFTYPLKDPYVDKITGGVFWDLSFYIKDGVVKSLHLDVSIEGP